jgi:uncharacterized membrane protein
VQRLRRTAARAAVVIVILGVALYASTHVDAPPILSAVGGAVFIGLIAWMFSSEQQAWPAAILALYLGLLDGYLKLSTGSSVVTLARDALMYAMVFGVLARMALRHERLALPPMSGWVLAFVAAVLVQLFNPADAGLQHSLGALRPHLEFVPLFFFGYYLLQTQTRLRRFFVVLLLCATANGVVNLVQYNLKPQQLAAWGPGYAKRINGSGDVAGRVFVDDKGNSQIRPFGLGADSGSGASVGLLSLGGALALLALGLRTSESRFGLLLCIGPPLAVVSGQSRTVVIAAFAALIYFTVLATSARRLIPTLAALMVGALVTVGVISVISANSNSSVFDRYKTIKPGQLQSTTQKSRGSSLSSIPKYLRDVPLGGGIGSVGPAASFAGGARGQLDGENQFTFYLSELGIPGLAVMLGFYLRLLLLSLRRVRQMDPQTRPLIAGIATGIAGLFASWPSGPTTANSPGAPYFWFAAGVLAFWLSRKPASVTSPRAA